ncbi:MAG: hypothetical protein IJ184_06460 [Alphaproteobacteria bacterium]|nr:hypothetical protein [Alphaproteobacteria bacterium]
MKKLFFVLTLLVFFTPVAFALDCDDLLVNPEITVTSSFGNLTYDSSKDINEITAMAKKFDLVESDLFASGLSVADINFNISLSSSASMTGIKEFCVTPSKVEIFLGFSSPMIYLANSLTKDSCQYNIVLRHEQTHQQINKSTLEYYLPIFKAAATNIIKQTKPIKISSTTQLGQTTKDLTDTYNQKLSPLVNFIKKEIAGEQHKLDNPANYKYESILCKE